MKIGLLSGSASENYSTQQKWWKTCGHTSWYGISRSCYFVPWISFEQGQPEDLEYSFLSSANFGTMLYLFSPFHLKFEFFEVLIYVGRFVRLCFMKIMYVSNVSHFQNFQPSNYWLWWLQLGDPTFLRRFTLWFLLSGKWYKCKPC